MAGALLLLLPGACGDPPPLYVDQAVVHVAPAPGAPSVGYFTVHASDVPVTLRDVMTDGAVRVEMHETRMTGTIARMAPIDSVAIPAKGIAAFAPGGRHLMLWGINPAAVAAGKLTLTFLFSNGDRILVDARVDKVGGMPGDMSGGMAMDHRTGR